MVHSVSASKLDALYLSFQERLKDPTLNLEDLLIITSSLQRCLGHNYAQLHKLNKAIIEEIKNCASKDHQWNLSSWPMQAVKVAQIVVIPFAGYLKVMPVYDLVSRQVDQHLQSRKELSGMIHGNANSDHQALVSDKQEMKAADNDAKQKIDQIIQMIHDAMARILQ